MIFSRIQHIQKNEFQNEQNLPDVEVIKKAA